MRSRAVLATAIVKLFWTVIMSIHDEPTDNIMPHDSAVGMRCNWDKGYSCSGERLAG